jgi:uncharacterized membrane protein
MESLLLLLVVITLLVILAVKRSISAQLRTLDLRLNDLTRMLNELRRPEADKPPVKEKPVEIVPAATHQVRPEPPQPEIARPEAPREPVATPPQERPVTPEPPITAPPVTQWTMPEPPPRRPGFFERHPDLEKFIGENLANKIGIAILVIGIGFFVKYAIDKDWINEIGRVFIGILAGGILLGIAHRLRESFTAFSSVLVGGGIAILYFTIAIAFHEYQIFSQVAAFALMVVITVFTVLLSVSYNRVELAVLAILGGFGSPFMVSTGEGNYIVLFSYMLILNGGMLVLAYHKKWRIVNIICYVFTVLIFGGWLAARFDNTDASMMIGSLIFATLFYLIFFAMNIVRNIREQSAFEAPDITLLLSNTFLYFSAGMAILSNDLGNDYRGLFTVLLAIFNFSFAYSLYRKASVDRHLVFMLIGLVLTFISLAAPIQLEGNYITLFWAAEAVLLLWLAQKSGIRIMGIASVAVTALMIISLILDWNNIYNDYESLTILLNKGYITGVAVIVSLALTLRMLRTSSGDRLYENAIYKTVLTITLIIAVYLVNLFELRHQLIEAVDSYAARTVIVGAYNMGFIAILLFVSRRIDIPHEFKQAIPLLAFIAMGGYLFFYHAHILDSRNEYLEGIASFTGFAFHYLLVGFLTVAAALSLKSLNRDSTFLAVVRQGHWWVYVFLFVFLASAELDHTVLLLMYTDFHSTYSVISQNHRIGFPILWGIASFVLIAIGLRKKIKMLRIISLVLFLITLLKLFLIDLRDISEGGKIAAFISLGILLLIVSFMYQRLKKLLLDDRQSDETPTL